MGNAAAQTKPRRSNGEGSVYETADGRLRGEITVTNPMTGAKARRVVSGRTRAEVTRKLHDLRRETERGNPATETTGAFLTGWLEADKSPSVRPGDNVSSTSASTCCPRSDTSGCRCSAQPTLSE